MPELNFIIFIISERCRRSSSSILGCQILFLSGYCVDGWKAVQGEEEEEEEEEVRAKRADKRENWLSG